MSRLYFMTKLCIGLLGLAFLSGCLTAGANTQPVIDGAVHPNYHIDLQQCQNLAARQPTVDGSTAGKAVGGASLLLS